MRSDESLRLELASAVADGRDIDWTVAETSMPGDDDRRFVQNLRVLAGVSLVHRSQPADAPERPDWNAATLKRPGGSETDQPGVWGDMRILHLVGEGTCGRVFRAWDERLGREVALKLFGDGADESDVIAEARLLARVRHPNMIVVHGADRHAGIAGIWMEFIPGRTLASIVLAQGPLGAREAVGIGLDICRALAAVHGAGLVHGDVKANNVMREEGGRIILMDLSSAKDERASKGLGRLSGTPLYMAPELFEGGSLSPGADIYSLGVLLYYLAAGSFPVNGANLIDLRAAHARGERRLLRDVRPDLPEAFVRVVEKALEPDPKRRFETIGRMEAALGTCAGEEATIASVRPSGWSSPGLRWSMSLAAVLLALLGLSLRPVGTATAPTPGRSPAAALAASQQPSFAVSTLSDPPAGPMVKTGSEAQAPGEARANSAVPGEALALTKSRSLPEGDTYTVEASFFRETAGLSLPLPAGARVAPGDRLSLEFKASRELHLYVLNEDERGNAFLLFPLPGQRVTNPLPADQRHHLPGDEAGRKTFWQVTSEGGREHFLLIASPTPLSDVEAAIAGIPVAEADRPVAIDGGTVAQLRGLGGLVRSEPAPPAEPSRLRDVVRLLLARPETIEGAWIRQFDLVS